jgi:hypothetical protein
MKEYGQFCSFWLRADSISLPLGLSHWLVNDDLKAIIQKAKCYKLSVFASD